MPTIEVDEETFRLLAFAARLSGVPEGQVVARLVAELAPGTDSTPRPAAPTSPTASAMAYTTVSPADTAGRSSTIEVEAEYLGHRFGGTTHIHSGRTRITEAPIELSAYDFQSPTAAAREVVSRVNPARENTETNGRLFWTERDSGRPLRDFMGRR